MKKNTCIFIKSVILLAYLLTLIVNALANTLPINNVTTGEISARYDTLFTPIGMTFSIWGVIYVLLGIFAVRVFFYDATKYPKMFARIGILFVLSSIMNITWLIFWHYDFILMTMIVMVALLMTLIFLVRDFRQIDANPWCFENVTFTVYLGWISIATIANVSITLVRYGFTGWGLSESIWTGVVLGVGLLIAGYVAFKLRTITYSAVFIWAYLGILIRHRTVHDNAYPLITIIASVSLLVLFLMILVIPLRHKTGSEI